MAVLAHGFNDMAENIQILVNKVREDEQKMRKADLRLLQEQINPHFLYNTLDTIVWSVVQCKQQDGERKWLLPCLIFSGGGSYTGGINRLLGQALWKPTWEGKTYRKGGLGSYHIEYEYYLSGKSGFYPWTRQAINAVHRSENEEEVPNE